MDAILALIDRTPLAAFLFLAAILGLAPFIPEPHIWEKLKMLAAGTLTKPVDIFDFVWHVWPFALLAIKLWRGFSANGIGN